MDLIALALGPGHGREKDRCEVASEVHLTSVSQLLFDFEIQQE